MSDQKRRGEIVSIQYLRGIAAILVVVAHSADQFHVGAIGPILRSVGQGGVDIFFVISGYVMTYTEAIHGYTRSEFVRRRLARIVPLYWFLTLATAALLIIAPDIASDSRFAWSDLGASLLFVPHYNAADPKLISPMLKLGWTLNYEMFFYFAFALVITLRPITRTLALTTAFSCILAATAVLHPGGAPLKFWGNPIVLEFLMGCVIGCIDLQRFPNAVPRTTWLAASALGAIAFLLLGAVDANLAERVLLRGLPAALIVFAALGLERSSPITNRNEWLHFLGDASYSIYLSHLFPIIILRVLWQKLQFPAAGPWQAAVFIAVAVIAGTAFGCLIHVSLERPLTRVARNFSTRPVPGRASAVGSV